MPDRPAIKMVRLDRIEPHPQNPREGDVGAITQLIEENGWYGCLIVQQSTGRILVGNHRYKAAQALGWPSLPVQYLDVDDHHALRILLSDNRSSDLATYDDQALADALTALASEPVGLTGTGWDGDDLDHLLADLNPAQPQTPPQGSLRCPDCGYEWMPDRRTGKG